MKYKAFISYSHKNSDLAETFHRRLERYIVPKRLRKSYNLDKTLRPVFLDRADYRSVGNYQRETRNTLQLSEALIVLCTPDSARSDAVDGEIRLFKQVGGEERVLPIIFEGEPNASDKDCPERECFPPSLRFALGADGSLTDQPINPIAADARTQGDGPADAFVKIVASILGVPYDEFKRRHLQAARRRLYWRFALAAAVLSTVILGLIVNSMITDRKTNKYAAKNAVESRQYDLAGNLVLASIAPKSSLITWSPEGLDQLLLEAGIRASFSVRGGGCAPEDVAPEQPCFAGDITLSLNKKTLGILLSETVVSVVAVKTGMLMSEIIKGGSKILSIALSPSGELIALGEADGTLSIFRTADGVLQLTKMFNGEILSLIFASEEKLTVIEGKKFIKRVKWTGAEMVVEASANLPDHLSASIDPTGNWALVRNSTRSTLIGPIQAGGEISSRLINISGRFSRWSFSSNGELLTLAANDALGDKFYLVRTDSREKLHSVGTKHKVITAIGISEDSARIVTGGIDGKVRIWQQGVSEPIQTLDTGFKYITWTGMTDKDGIVSAIGNTAEAAPPGLYLYSWRIDQPEHKLTLRGHSSEIQSALFAHHGQLVTAADDASVRIWKIGKAFNIVNQLKRNPSEALSEICADQLGPFASYLTSPPNKHSLLCEKRRLFQLPW